MLVNNAGAMPGERTETADGVELMFATHVLAPFVLISSIAGTARPQSAPSSRDQRQLGWHVQPATARATICKSEQVTYSPPKIYARTKREQVVITEMLGAAAEGNPGVVVHAMHPGWVGHRRGCRQRAASCSAIDHPSDHPRLSTPAPTRSCGSGPQPEALQSTGGFWHDRRERPTHYLLGAGAESELDRQRLWDLCVALSAEAVPGR